MAGRSDSADLLDAELASWIAGQSQKEALSTLRSAGVDAEAVVHSYDVDLDEQMNARGYWEEVAHPIVGPKRFPAWPMRFASTDSPRGSGDRHRCSASTTTRCWASLGITEDELAVLAAEGIIGTRPSGA